MTPPSPTSGHPPYGILSDAIIGDVTGKQARTVCNERIRLGFPPVTQRHRVRQWQCLHSAWGVEAAERFLARSPGLLSEFRAFVATLGTKKATKNRLPFVTVPKTSPQELSQSWSFAPAMPEVLAEKRAKAEPKRRETVDEFVARGGKVQIVESGVVTAKTLAILAKLREGFPRDSARTRLGAGQSV